MSTSWLLFRMRWWSFDIPLNVSLPILVSRLLGIRRREISGADYNSSHFKEELVQLHRTHIWEYSCMQIHTCWGVELWGFPDRQRHEVWWRRWYFWIMWGPPVVSCLQNLSSLYCGDRGHYTRHKPDIRHLHIQQDRTWIKRSCHGQTTDKNEFVNVNRDAAYLAVSQ